MNNVTRDFDSPEFPASIRSGDSDALRAVVDAYMGQVHRAARGAGLTPQEAEEVTQGTFTTFIEAAPRFEGRSHVRTWLFGIMYKKISEARRQLSRARDLEDIDRIVESRFKADGSWSRPPRRADASLHDREIRGQISDCLDDLPTAQRAAFSFREVEGLTTSEICKILGVTSTNLGVMLYRARNRLRECLEAKGVWGVKR